MTDGFPEYAAARWPVLVRVALLLGAPPGLAPDLATEALSRLRGQWRRLASSGDPDTEVLDLVVAAWHDLRSRDWWTDHPAEPTPAGLGALDDLARSERTALVLHHVGGIEADGATAGSPADPQLWAAARALPVAAPAPGDLQLRDSARRRRRRRTRNGVGVGAAVAAVVVTAVLVAVGVRAVSGDVGQPGVPRALSAVAVTTGPQAWVTWYAAGQLHLGTAALDVAGPQAVVSVSGGAVYVDRGGRVVRIDPRGARELLGRTDDSSTLVASPDGGLVAWVDTKDAGRRVLTVVAGADGGGRRTLVTPGGDELRPVGLGADRLYVTDGRRSWSWSFEDADALTSLGEAGLVSVTGGLAVFGPATTTSASLRVAVLGADGQVPPEETWLDVSGDEVVLPPSGQLVLTRTKAGQVELTSLSPRRSEPTGIFGYEVALAAAVGPDDQIAYLVARAADRPKSGDFVRSTFAGTVTLRTCTLSVARHATECHDVAQVSGTDETPLLAR